MEIHEGSIDTHVHAGPSFFDRRFDPIELAALEQEAGMAGFVLKNHFGSTYQAATLAQERYPSVDVYPSLVLNTFVGGFNLSAVEHALTVGTDIVWLPTFSAANHPDDFEIPFPFSGQSLKAVDTDGELLPGLMDVLKKCDEYDETVTVGSGHLSESEVFAIFNEIKHGDYDVEFLVTHPDIPFIDISPAKQRELAERGAIIEKTHLTIQRGDLSADEMVKRIDTVGPDHCVISTDHGQVDTESPPNAFKTFVRKLKDRGLSDREIEQMAVTNPERAVHK